MAKGANSIVRIPCKDIKGFFYYWIMFLKPFHRLTDRESEVIVSMLRERYELSKVIKDSEILDKVLMSEDTKKKIREECEITLPHFQIVLSKLRKNKVLIDNKLNPRFIPRVTEDMDSFKMVLLFDFQ